MDYCTENDITQRYGVKKIGQLTGDPTGTTVDSAKMAEVISDVSSMIDLYIGKQVALPLDAAQVPGFLRPLAVAEVYYQLKCLAPAGANGVAEMLYKQHEDRMRMLRDIAAGRITLGVIDVDAGRVTLPVPEEPLRTKTRLFGREA